MASMSLASCSYLPASVGPSHWPTTAAGRSLAPLRIHPCRRLSTPLPRNLHIVSATGGPSVSLNSEKKRIAIFLSGGGSNFKAIHRATLDGSIHGQVVVVISDKEECGGVAYAKEHGIPTHMYPARKSGVGLTDGQLLETLRDAHRVDVVALAGFLKLVPAGVVAAFQGRMLNIHPALLPAFGGKGLYGMNVHRAVVRSGARFSGPTVHFVDEAYDTGPILAQRVVPVYPTDTPEQVAARVLKEEHLVYPAALAALCGGRVTWREDGVPVLWEAL